MSKFQASSKKAEKLVKKYSEHIPPEDPTTAPEYDASNFGDFHTYYEHKKQKLQNRNALLRLHTAGEGYPQIFRGVVAWVNGYTAPSAQDLMEMIVVRGGVMLQYLEGKTALTHVIASKLTPKKLVEWQRYRVVRPEWVVECVKEGKLLPWEKWRVGGEGEQSQALRVEKGTREGSYKQQDLERLRSGSGSGSGSGTPVTRSQRMGFPGSALGRRVEEIGDVGDEEEGEQAVKEEEEAGREISSQPDIPQLVLTPPQPASLVKKEVTSPPAPHQPPAKRQKTRDEHGHDETAKLLANPHIRNSTVLNPGFLKQYYQESRLHHLSTWKANLKQHLQELVLSVPTPSQSNQPPPPRRYIFHIDFDCFFAAVSILYHPNPASLEGKPVCVTHATGASGDVASCNYTARARGVKNGMWLGQAKELCPEIICLPYEFERYEEVSRAFYGILIDVAKQKIGVVVQSVSVDEAVMDVTPLCYDSTSKGSIKKEQDIADSLASSIRSKVKETTRCDVSIGISSNPLLARLALRRAKPSGQVQLRPGNETNEFLGPLRVQDLPSVGSSTAGKLAANGVTNIEQLRELSMHKLKDIVGDKTGGRLFNYARGIDDTPVTGAGGADTAERKSVSADVNWGVRFETQEQAEEFLLNLAGEVKRRLEEQGVKGRKLTLKVMKRAAGAPIVTPKFLGSGKCDTLCKSVHVGEEGKATWDPEILGKEAVKILRGFSSDPKELRGLGMQMTKLE
ncbi:DNA polymerase IV, partial [Peziza echinospora]